MDGQVQKVAWLVAEVGAVGYGARVLGYTPVETYGGADIVLAAGVLAAVAGIVSVYDKVEEGELI
jgi:hypothetical protein